MEACLNERIEIRSVPRPDRMGDLVEWDILVLQGTNNNVSDSVNQFYKAWFSRDVAAQYQGIDEKPEERLLLLGMSPARQRA
jgi:hypothetical protein